MDAIELVDKSDFTGDEVKLDFDLLVNKKLLRDALKIKEEVLNIIGFLESCKSSGKYFLYTCGCGDAGCADFYEPSKVDCEGDVVILTIAEMYHDQKFDKPLVFRFKKDEYLGIGRKIVEKLKEAFLIERENKKSGWRSCDLETLLKREDPLWVDNVLADAERKKAETLKTDLMSEKVIKINVGNSCINMKRKSLSSQNDFGAFMSGSFVVKAADSKVSKSMLESFLKERKNELPFLCWFLKIFGDPNDESPNVFSWDFEIDDKFKFEIIYSENGFEAMFDCANSSYELREKYIPLLLKALTKEVQPFLAIPREKLLTQKVRRWLEKTKNFNRIWILNEREPMRCIFCGNEIKAQLVDVVRPDISSRLKEQLLKMELNKIICSDCGFTYTIFRNGFRYMDESGLSITLHSDEKTARDVSDLSIQQQKKLIDELGEEAEVGGFSVQISDPRLMVEYIKKYDPYHKLMKKEAVDRSLEKDCYHNYKKFYFSYLLGDSQNAFQFLSASIRSHALKSDIPLSDEKFFAKIDGTNEDNLNVLENESLFLRFLCLLVKNGKLDDDFQKAFPKIYNKTMCSYTFGPFLEDFKRPLSQWEILFLRLLEIPRKLFRRASNLLSSEYFAWFLVIIGLFLMKYFRNTSFEMWGLLLGIPIFLYGIYLWKWKKRLIEEPKNAV